MTEHFEGDVVAADGGTVHVRPIRPDDAPRIEEFHARQSAESIYYRYFSARPHLTAAEIDAMVNVDGRDRMAFVALLGDDIVGVARYDRFRHREEAEVAFFVDDAHTGRGLGTILLEYLVAAGREAGITGFVATVLPSNRRMLTMLRQVGFEAVSAFADGVVEVRFALEPTPGSEAARAAREAAADARSVERLLAPASVAVIGAGRRTGMGHEILCRLLEHDFNGPVYPINREATYVSSVRAYPSVLDVPDRVDLAVIAVPVPDVETIVTECARARVGGLVVVTAGFGETGEEGLAAERALVAEARRNGMRLLGPNSLGIINTAPSVRLHATFARVEPRAGRVALSAQSGALAAAVVARATELGLGMSSVVSVGNKADVSGNDLLRFWHTDDRTDVVLLYLESFGNPRRFGRIAQDVARTKPIVAVKARPDPGTDALLDQTGVVRVDTLDRLLDVARVLASQPVPPGDRVVVLGNSGGPALLAADACRGAGLDVVSVGTPTAEALMAALPPGARADGPIDLTYAASAAQYEQALRLALADDGVDTALVLYTPALDEDVAAVARAIAAASASAPGKTVVASLAGTVGRRGRGSDEPGTVPSFVFPDAAAYALGRAAAYGRWRAEVAGEVHEPLGVDGDAARAIAAAALASEPSGTWLEPEDACALLHTAGVSVIEVRFVHDAASAAKAAAEVGFPVALKATGLDHLPKSEAGGIALDLQDAGEVTRAYDRMASAHADAMRTAAVQRMSAPGTDVRVRIVPDDVVGVAVGLGPGGAAGERMPDDTVRLVPVTDAGATALVSASAVATALDPADSGALVDLVARVAWLADAVPDIAELIANPVIVGEGRASVADARVRVAPWRRDQLDVRRL